MVDDESCFVVVLIGEGTRRSIECLLTILCSADEVESLTAARAGAMSGKEPSDALRVSGQLARLVRMPIS